jgi:hypothetical protein
MRERSGSRETTGQGRFEDSTRDRSERRFEGSRERSTTNGRDRSEGRFEGSRERSTTTGRGDRTRTDTNVNVDINEQQRTRIRDVVVAHRDIPRVSDVNVNLRVGGVVPRSVRLVSVPEDIVRIYPRFRRHRVVIIRDEIVIVDPVTFRIVAVLPA